MDSSSQPKTNANINEDCEENEYISELDEPEEELWQAIERRWKESEKPNLKDSELCQKYSK